MKTIPLTRGYFTKVDDDDYKKFAVIRWYASSGQKHVRAVRKSVRDKNGKQTHISLAREILQAPKGKYVDHINGDTLDNRKCNLRLCTFAENLYNRGASKNSTSGYKGVYRHRNLWRAIVKINKKLKYSEYFRTKEEAILAYNKAAKKLHGEFARINDIL